jgi:hypothetical protein
MTAEEKLKEAKRIEVGRVAQAKALNAAEEERTVQEIWGDKSTARIAVEGVESDTKAKSREI